MASSKTDIANRALSKIGDSRVSNINTDGTEKALIIREMYDQVRDNMLRSYPWNFAIKRSQLAKDGTAPAWGYSNRFQLPSDFLALLEIKNQPDYKLESDYILTDEGAPLYIKYVRKVTSEGLFDPSFVEAFSSMLAIEICEPLTQSNTKKELLLKQHEEIIRNAYAIDAIADPPQRLPDDEWLLSRESSIYYDDIDYNISSS